MAMDIENWKTQIRKGYLELCILVMIQRDNRLYGFQILSQMEKLGLSLKEGTLYPLLSRMTEDGVLSTEWETEGPKGHPRKFYTLTSDGRKLLDGMQIEFNRMTDILENLNIDNPRRKTNENSDSRKISLTT